jgi:ribosome-associated protein
MERRTAITTKKSSAKSSQSKLERVILQSLDSLKAENTVTISLVGKSDMADSMIIASGTSQRHVASLADKVVQGLKAAGYTYIHVEGQDTCEWVLVDAGNVVVHIFRPEVRQYYNLEKMWSVNVPQLEAAY